MTDKEKNSVWSDMALATILAFIFALIGVSPNADRYSITSDNLVFYPIRAIFGVILLTIFSWWTYEER